MSRKYKNPPIEEALVEFRFPATGWDLTIPGRLQLHPAIRETYTGKPRTQQVLKAEESGLALSESVRVVLPNISGLNLLTLGPDTLSVNTLKPYDSWESFLPRIISALQAYIEIVDPKVVNRIGVRYVNRIIVSSEGFDIAKYLCCAPRLGADLPKTMKSLLSRVELNYEDSVKLLITQALIEAPEGHSGILLDLDVINESADGIPITDAMRVVEDLHEREGRAFEAAITEASREVFDAD